MPVITLIHPKYGVVRRFAPKGKCTQLQAMTYFRNFYGLKIFECTIDFPQTKKRQFHTKNDSRPVIDLKTGETYETWKYMRSLKHDVSRHTIYTHLYKRLSKGFNYRFKWAN